MNTTHNHANKNYTNLKRILEDLSGNKFESLNQKLKDLSGNNFKDVSPEEFTNVIGDSLNNIFGGVKDALSTLVTSEEFITFIRSIFTPVITMLFNTIIYNDPGQLGKDKGYNPDDPLAAAHVCYDAAGNCVCEACSINDGLIGKLVKEVTKKEIIGDEETLGLLDYYVKAKLMVVGILIGIIVWKTLTLTKKISLFMLGRPN
tara:strand:+ start:2568 stop:3176 length:609 start_codon:yes stop_codon:yes gene_type:complete